MTPKEQRAALVKILQRIFPDTLLEYSGFEWLVVPDTAALSGPLGRVYDHLVRHRHKRQFATKGYRLSCDIVIPSMNTIIEYDERQHFSVPRAISLRQYPPRLTVGFNVHDWIAHCEQVQARDNDPPHRDEQRAFYDSCRDLGAAENGHYMIRIKHGSFDWTGPEAEANIRRILPLSKAISRKRHQQQARRLLKHASNVPTPPPMPARRSPRFATVCIEGSTARGPSAAASRLALLDEVAQAIDERPDWRNLDAVILPGGFLRLDRSRPTGDFAFLSHPDRVKVLAQAGYGHEVSGVLGRLTHSPGALIVAGVDGPRSGNCTEDQLSVAWSDSGIVGIGRKVFPVDSGKAGTRESDWLTCQALDYSSANRVITLPSGHRAILCACYDMFGVAMRPIQVEGVRRLLVGAHEFRRDARVTRARWSPLPTFTEQRDQCLRSWSDLIASNRVSVGIATIHYFGGHSTTYWQRHGIASCSAALPVRPRVAIGAAHFGAGLPRNVSASSLASREAPKDHLDQGVDREPCSLAPVDSFQIPGAIASLVRLFTV